MGYVYPASYDHVISVGASWTVDDYYSIDEGQVWIPRPHGNSNNHNNLCEIRAYTLNDKVDLVAPQADVRLKEEYNTNGCGWYPISGTSHASPLVAGTAALILSVNDCFSAEDVEEIIKGTTINIDDIVGNSKYAGRYGTGKLDAFEAVKYAKAYSEANAGADIVCAGSTIGPDILDRDGNVIIDSEADYSWSPSVGLSDPSIPNPTTSIDGIEYTLTMGNRCGEITTDKVYVGGLVDAGDDRSCPGRIGPDIIDEGATYSWSPTLGLDDPTSPNPFANPYTTTTYTVTMTNACGNSHTDQVTVTPNYEIDFVEINGHVTWDESTWNVKGINYFPHRIKNRILVTKGSSLTIRNATIEFGPKGSDIGTDANASRFGIVVEEGAELILDHATLTTLSGCDNFLWKGVEVWSLERLQRDPGGMGAGGMGSGAKGGPSFVGAPPVRGTLTMQNSTIENAHIGVLADNSIGVLGLINSGKHYGGSAEINITNSRFENNRIGIAYEDSWAESNSIIQKTDFVCSDLLYDQEMYEGEGTENFIQISGTDGVRILGNTFKTTTDDLTYHHRCTGVKSYNSQYIVSTAEDHGTTPATLIQNRFKDIAHGVDAYATGGLDGVLVDRNIFENVYFGVTLQGTAYDQVTNNQFIIREAHLRADIEALSSTLNFDGDENNMPYAVYTAGSAGFEIAYNEIEGTQYDGCVQGSMDWQTDCRSNYIWGVNVRNSTAIGGSVHGNKFKEITVGVETQYDNPALLFNCNEFKDMEYAMDFNFGTTGSLADQSSSCEDMSSSIIPLEDKIIPDNTFVETYSSVTFVQTNFNDYGHLYADEDSWTDPINGKVIYNDNPNNPYLPFEMTDVSPYVDYANCGVTNPNTNYPSYNCILGIQPPSSGGGSGSSNALLNSLGTTTNKTLRQLKENALIRFYLQSGDEAAAMAYLDAQATEASNLQLVGAHLKKKETSKARAKLSSIPVNQGTSKAHQLYDALITLEESEIEISNMNAADEALLRTLAGNNEPITGSDNAAIQAQGILDRVFGEKYGRWFVTRESLPNSTQTPMPRSGIVTEKELAKAPHTQLTIAPNPGTHSTTISINNAGNENMEESYTVQVYTMQGVRVKEVTLLPKEVCTLYRDEIGTGMFYMVLRNAQGVLDQQKMVMIK